jgi:hypothetical protein
MPNAGFLSFFMTLPALRNTNQVFCRLCVYWNSLAVFHTIKLGSGFWQEVTGMRYRYCPLHKEYLSSTWPTIHDVDLSPQRHFLSNFPFAHIFSPSSTLFRHILHINLCLSTFRHVLGVDVNTLCELPFTDILQYHWPTWLKLSKCYENKRKLSIRSTWEERVSKMCCESWIRPWVQIPRNASIMLWKQLSKFQCAQCPI